MARRRFAIEQTAVRNAHNARRGVDREAPAGVVVQCIGDDIGRAIRIECAGGEANECSVRGVLVHCICG